MPPTSSQSDTPDGQRRFATTSWSLVLQATGKDEQSANSDALAQLCEAYWYPLYAYVRRLGNDKSEAEDLTQAFFAELLERRILDAADQQRGRFRSFLLAAVSNFVSNQWRSQQTQKRGSGQTILSLDFSDADRRFQAEPSSDLTADKVFERQWAMQLLALAMNGLRLQYLETGKEDQFQAIKPFLSPSHDVPYAQIAQQLGMQVGAIKVAIHRLRQRYGQQLRLQIAKTVEKTEEVDDELKRLFQALSQN